MTQVRELQPGDLVRQGLQEAVYIAQTWHPIWPSLRLVVWKLDDGSWSHDASAAHQDVGQAVPSTAEERTHRLAGALTPGRAVRDRT